MNTPPIQRSFNENEIKRGANSPALESDEALSPGHLLKMSRFIRIP